MSGMITHVMIVSGDSNSPSQAPNRFILSGLEEFDQMKVVLEQTIFADFLQVCSSTTSISDLNENILGMFTVLPDTIYNRDKNLEILYASGLDIIRRIQRKEYKALVPLVPDLLNIFYHNPLKTYYNQLYTPTITETFLTEWLAMRAGYYDAETYPNGILDECAIYIPRLNLADFRLSQNNPKELHLCVTMEPRSAKSFDLRNAFRTKPEELTSYLLNNFDLSDLSVDDLIPIYASFAIDHDKYDIANETGSCKVTMADVCFDMITGSSYVSDAISAGIKVVDKQLWLDSIKSAINAGTLKTVKNNRLFGELLQLLGEDSNIVNYFTKDINHISSQEAFAFRSSMFADIVRDKLFPGNEADDGNADADNPENGTGEADTDNEDTQAENIDEDDSMGDLGGSDEMGLDDSNKDQPDQSAEKVKPQIDPDKMLLELANPNSEPMSDYLYREIVAQRISSVIKNPPLNARPNDIKMLKRWRSRWLYLASIACLRDFLTRVSLRLSN